MKIRKSVPGAVWTALLALDCAAAAPSPDTPAGRRALALTQADPAAVQAGADDRFEVRSVVVDPDGAQHTRMNRRHKGLPVIGGDVVVHATATGRLSGASLKLSAPLQIDIRPAQSGAAALAYAASLLAARLDAPPSASLAIDARGGAARLVYDVVARGMRADSTPSIEHLILDADSLQLVDRYDDVHTLVAPGSAAAGRRLAEPAPTVEAAAGGVASTGIGRSLLSGVVVLDTESAGGIFRLRDPLRAENQTNDMANLSVGNGVVFSSVDDVWGNFLVSNRATVAADAHYGMAQTWDFFRDDLGRDGIDGRGTTTFSRVHYSSNYSNAFWSDSCFCMTYGDGDGRRYYPLVAVDVTGHEMSHGVTAASANLIYSGESGGLNEATSDIFGTLVEFRADNLKNPPNYLIGERVFSANDGLPYPTNALRYMFKPSLDGFSPDCYRAGLGQLDVHYSSGVANHFFYLLAEGAAVPRGFGQLAPKDLVCSGSTALTPIGRAAAGRIWYRALTVYLTSSSKYRDARAATLRAATDLYGAGSREQLAVGPAWSAVDVE